MKYINHQHLIILILFIFILINNHRKCFENNQNKNSKTSAIKQVHKFSIGKDFDSLEQLDQDKLIYMTNNLIYPNIPATLSTKSIKTTLLKNHSNSTTTKHRKPPTTKITKSTLSKTTTHTTSTHTTSTHTTSTHTTTKTTTTTKSTTSSTKSMKDNINQVLEDLLNANEINYTNISKGRSLEDTKAVMNYMLTSLYNIKTRQQAKKFDLMTFLDKIFLKPTDISPDGLFEKDIVLSKEQAYKIFSKHFSNEKYSNKTDSANVRKVIKDSIYRWPMPIKYFLDDNYSEYEKELIRKSIRRWEESTCVYFEELKSLNDDKLHYLKIAKGQGCWSPIGYIPDAPYQELSLGEGCLNKGTILHEIGHTLGFFHEQSRPDRDEYVDIVRKNIAVYGEINFEKYSDNEIAKFEVPYDLASDMHYGSLYFSSNNKATIEPKDKRYQRTIGQRNDLSFSDIKTANNVYCKNRCSDDLKCERGGYPNPRNCLICTCPDGFTGPLCDQLAPSLGVCGGLLRNNTGVLETPNYPFYYPGFISCNWLIQAPVGYKIRLNLAKIFSTSCDQYAYYGPCDQDWLEIRENSNYFFQGGPRFCCTQGPNTTVSFDNEMLVLFRSSIGNINSNGFRATYEFIDKDGNVLIEKTTTSTKASTTTTTKTTSTQTTTLDYCRAKPCLNGGSCYMTPNGFKCNCSKSFTGNRCESRISKCKEIKCENNGICLENFSSCLCPNGYTGDRCQTALDSCSSNPCIKGVCVNLAHDAGYKCFCFNNYTGPRCEIAIQSKHCKTDLCLNGGKCVESPLLEGFVCKCPRNYFGIFCESSLCSNKDLCGQNGTCHLKPHGGYYCECNDGAIRNNCNTHPCLANVCGDYGLCEPVDNITNNNYKCNCKPGFNGKHCDNKLNSCESNPCSNGKCVSLYDYDYKCECFYGYTGKNCDISFFTNSSASVCYSNPCLNNGICFEKRFDKSQYVCFCPPGYVGLNCEFMINLDQDICNLKSGLCKHGKCKPDRHSFICECESNWLGTRCDIFNQCLNPNPCLNNGTCLQKPGNDYLCSCPSGYSGKNCEIETHVCPDDLCLNGGKCLVDKTSILGFRCLCTPDFIGTNCLYNLNSCSSNPCTLNQICKNKAYSYECINVNENQLSHINNDNNEDINYEDKINDEILNLNETNKYVKNKLVMQNISNKSEFSSLLSINNQLNIYSNKTLCILNNPCKNDGICTLLNETSQSSQSYICKCKFGYVGKHCDFIDECLIRTNICRNNGTCIMSESTLTCICQPGFKPPYCIDKINNNNTKLVKLLKSTSLFNQTLCDVNVCKNNGTCVHTDIYNEVNNSYIYGMKCLCPSTYTGTFCEKNKKKFINIEINQLNESNKKLLPLPNICNNNNNVNTELVKQPASIRILKLSIDTNTYYLIQNDLVWFIKDGKLDKLNKNKWPVKLSDIFHESINEEQIDSVIYDNFRDEIYLFKSNKYWVYKKITVNVNVNETEKDNLINENKLKYEFKFELKNGYPKDTKEDFGMNGVQGGFFSNENSLLLFKDSKIVHHLNWKAKAIYFLPFEINNIQFILNLDENKFYILGESKLFLFSINFKNHQVFLLTVDSELTNSFFCEAFNESNEMSKSTNDILKINLRKCPDLSSINSIIKLNSSTAVMLTNNDQIEYLDYGLNGYKFSNNSLKIKLDLDINENNDRISLINLNRILFLFQNDIVWMYSLTDDLWIKGTTPSIFTNLFPNKIGLYSIISSHYSPKTKKFYFFTEKYYVEYESENKIERRNSIKYLSSKLTNVIQNNEDYDSVYLIDANNFVYYLNLNNNYLESIERKTACLKLFSNCIHSD